ncbi:hypothetical protein OHA72_31580 [Dactylosporangium sp. NBC_01737]|uniref:hypothetical protein n=1 Tax=Dactylosporangium sp. NBC_01737 TaxID=2975959 RepID=UPI002E115976|nr:hypothetical protein OHA72_31580 [Dactylosporangium sp. NBC_01737]
MLVHDASRWPVLAFASVHVLGLLTHHPVPWSATLTAASLLVVTAATVRASTGTLRTVALPSGLTAVAGLVAEVEYRGGGVGWPFFLTEAPAGTTQARLEAALLTLAVLGLSAAALLPEHGTEEHLRGRLRTWYADRRTTVLDLLEPPPAPDPATGAPVVLDLGLLTPHPTTPPPSRSLPFHQRSDHQRSDHQRSDHQRSDHQRSDHPRRDPDPSPPGQEPDRWRSRRSPDWWRSRLVAAGTVGATVLAVAVATRPLWTRDHFGQIPLAASRDGAGLLLAVVPPLLAAAAGTVAVCRSLRTSRRGTALAALALVALTVPVAWARGGEPRFSPEPPPSQVLHVATLTEYVHRPDPGLLPPRLVHPSPPAHPSPPPDATDVTARDDAGWWINPLDWDEVSDGVLTGVALAAFLALTAALLPPPRRPDLRP